MTTNDNSDKKIRLNDVLVISKMMSNRDSEE